MVNLSAKQLREAEYIATRSGEDEQCRQTTEELAELIVAFNKWHRAGSGDPDEMSVAANNLIDEIADVKIMIAQIEFLLAIDDKVLAAAIEAKLQRQLKRLGARP